MKIKLGIGKLFIAMVFGGGMMELRAQSGEFMPPISNNDALAAHQVQGEYFGTTASGAKLGAWIVAKGNNSFALSLLPGGLLGLTANDPQGGWNGVAKYTGTANFNGTSYSVTTANGYKTTTITGTGYDRVLNGTTSNNESFTLNRVNRQSPTRRLRPKAEWGTAQTWFDSATAQADLTKWKQRDNAVQLKYNHLFRGILSAAKHGAGFLHIEARSSFNPTASGQDRGNSGIYLQGKFEMQVLDSFGLGGDINETGAIYGVKAPIVNAALPPLTFQTYDCYFTPYSATNRFATITLYVNGVLVQNKTKTLEGKVTEAGITGDFLAESELYLQNHTKEVVFDNIWFIPGATGTTLPFTNLVDQGSTSLSPGIFKSSLIRENKSLDRFQIGNGIDMTGRKVIKRGAHSLMIIPEQ
jgi:hypothetical protein